MPAIFVETLRLREAEDEVPIALGKKVCGMFSLYLPLALLKSFHYVGFLCKRFSEILSYTEMVILSYCFINVPVSEPTYMCSLDWDEAGRCWRP